jgi:hypothetical protein
LAIPQEVKDRFQQLVDAACEDRLCIVEVTRKGRRKGNVAFALCESRYALGDDADNGDNADEVQMVPLGEIPLRDPFKLYAPPEGARDVKVG